MSTLTTDKLYDEAQTVQPADLPVNGSPIDISAAGKVYHVIDVAPLAVASEIDVEVRYQAADVSNTAVTFKENAVVIKALVARFPELRQAFTAVEARAYDASGHDYGSLMPMKDVKD